MRVAILSDVHGNIEALNAVIADIQLHRPDEIFFLGDAINYGCNSVQVVERLSQIVKPENWLLGNHEELFFGAPSEIFGEEAKVCDAFTKAEMEGTESEKFLQYNKDVFPRTLIRRVKNKLIILSHHRPVFSSISFDEYYDPAYLSPYVLDDLHKVLSTSIPITEVPSRNWLKSMFCGKSIDQLIFFGGHSHMPALAYLNPTTNVCVSEKFRAGRWRFSEIGTPEMRFFINPGSVGYSRDGCPQASYAFLDLDKDIVEVNRVPYTLNLHAFENRYKSIHDLKMRTILGGLTQKIKNASVPNPGKMPADWWDFYQKEPC